MKELPQAFAPRRSSAVGRHGPQTLAALEPNGKRTAFNRLRYLFQKQVDAPRLVVHIPGANPLGIDLEVNAPDVIVTAVRDDFASALPWHAPPIGPP